MYDNTIIIYLKKPYSFIIAKYTIIIINTQFYYLQTLMKTFKDEICGILIALVHLLEVDDLQIFILNKHKIIEYVSLLRS